MLNYHHSGDIYHCIYRICLLISHYGENEIEWERLRLMDFYYVFPYFLKDFKTPREYLPYKRIFKSIPEPYEEVGSPKRLFYQLGTMQDSAVRSLVAKGYVDRDLLFDKSVVKLIKPIPQEIIDKFKEDERIRTYWFQPFITLFKNVELSGNDGLKVRTAMMEHRYDPI